MALVRTSSLTAQPRNILLIVADDLGVDKLRMYYPDPASAPETVAETPTLDLLAALGVRFTIAWANPVCSTTRATIQTSRFSFRTGIGAALGPDDPPTVIFVGDNGTDGPAIKNPPYPLNHGKTTVFEGGIRVPLLIPVAVALRHRWIPIARLPVAVSASTT